MVGNPQPTVIRNMEKSSFGLPMEDEPRIYTINPRQRVVVRNGIPRNLPHPNRKKKTAKNDEIHYNNGIRPYGATPTEHMEDATERKPRRKRPPKSEEPQIMPLYGPTLLETNSKKRTNNHRRKQAEDPLRNSTSHTRDVSSLPDPVAPVINSMTAYDFYYPSTNFDKKSSIVDCFRSAFACLTCRNTG